MAESPDTRRSSFARRLRSFVVIIGLLVGVASIFVVSRMGAVYRHPIVAMKLLTASAEPALPVPV